jgi:hypothetical protein
MNTIDLLLVPIDIGLITIPEIHRALDDADTIFSVIPTIKGTEKS